MGTDPSVANRRRSSGWSSDSVRLRHPRQGPTRRSMSAASSPLKPLASSPAATFDAVAIAIAEAYVELSPEHALFRSSEIPAKTRGLDLFPPRAPHGGSIRDRFGPPDCQPLPRLGATSQPCVAIVELRGRLDTPGQGCTARHHGWPRPPGDTRTSLALDFVGSRFRSHNTYPDRTWRAGAPVRPRPSTC